MLLKFYSLTWNNIKLWSLYLYIYTHTQKLFPNFVTYTLILWRIIITKFKIELLTLLKGKGYFIIFSSSVKNFKSLRGSFTHTHLD